jgi:hypothetical protein
MYLIESLYHTEEFLCLVCHTHLSRRCLCLSSFRLCLCLSTCNLVASCPMAPLLTFATHLLVGCRVACCRVPPPCVTVRRAAISRVHPQPPFYICASWLLHCTSLHRLCYSTCRRLTTSQEDIVDI